jgi:DNA topoisomerase-1
VCRIPLGPPAGEGEQAEQIYIRVGRYGPFLEQGQRRASLPEKLAPDELTVERALEMLDQAGQGEEPLGICPDTHKPVFVKMGRFGPYVQRGTAEDDEKPQSASLLKGMVAKDVDLATALKLLVLPRTLGNHPQTGEPVLAHNGRYGPYVKCAEETRSLPDDCSPLDVSLEQALALLAQPKARRGAASNREPLKVFDVSPVTNQPVRLMQGRYGPYVSDGTTNASLPRGTSTDEVTLEYALGLLKARADAGPAKRPARKKAGPRTTKAAKGAKKTVKKTAKKVAKKAARKKEA